MIIQSLLDTDLYKFTMMQVVLHHFPGAQVEFKFKCRTEGVDFRPYLDEIREEVAALTSVRFSDEELRYLRGLRFMKSDFVDFLGLFHFNEKYVRIGFGGKGSERVPDGLRQLDRYCQAVAAGTSVAATVGV